jgi:hypothetical protein
MVPSKKELPMTADQLLPLAQKMAMPVKALAALPVVVEVFASKTGMTQDAMVKELIINAPLRAYAEKMCIVGVEGLQWTRN